MSFKKALTFEERVAESKKIMDKHPDLVPVIVERYKNCDLPEIDKHKFLVPRNFEVGKFHIILRNRIKVAPEQALFLFIDNTIPPVSALMNDIYEQLHDKDGFLYIVYTSESTFGNIGND